MAPVGGSAAICCGVACGAAGGGGSIASASRLSFSVYSNTPHWPRAEQQRALCRERSVVRVVFSFRGSITLGEHAHAPRQTDRERERERKKGTTISHIDERSSSSRAMAHQQQQLDATAVENFRDYLRIPSVHPNINYDDCVKFLEKQAKSLDLPVKICHVHPKKPIVVITWTGTDPSLPAILLNSHMDVVPVFADQWTYPPFSAHMDEEGNIYARGSQDMKCVGIQYLEAIRRIKLQGRQFKRTIHMSFVPEEEIGGKLGMKEFVHTKDFRALNVGFALDEGVASPTENYYMFYGERSIWQVEVHCPGNPGHGSMLLDNTAGEKVRIIIDKFMDFRAKQKARLADPTLNLGNVTSINLTKINGGVQANVIPNNITVTFDCRIDPDTDQEEFEAMLKSWCKEAGKGVHITYHEKNPLVPNTKLDDDNLFWLAFKDSCDRQKINLEIGIFPGGTDSRYVRSLGIPAIGFSPMNKTPILLHDHDEYLNKDVFLNGIKIYMDIIPSVANV